MPQSMSRATTRTMPLVMITGASSGISKALAFAFAREGNPLLLISRHIEPIAGLPGSTIYRHADVADYAAIVGAVAAAEAVHGPAGCLINNAGMADARAFDEVDEPDYTRELATNLKGVLNATKAVSRCARRKRSTASASSTSRRAMCAPTSTAACISASRNTAPGSATRIS